MQPARRVFLVLMTLLAFGSSPLWAQAPTTGTSKAVDGKKPAASSKARPTIDRPTLDKLKLPPGGVVIVVEEAKEALALSPKMVLMAPEEYQKLLERLAFLEKQLKAEKKTAHACKLSGRIEGNFAIIRADLVFTTEQPRTAVFLGFLGAQLTDEGQLDRHVPFVDFGDDGFFVNVEKEGIHQLTLNLKVPVSFKRPALTGNSGERGFDLSLPGAAVTTLALDLPPGVKELRWNDMLEKPRQGTHWDLALGKIKTLSLSWKELVSLPGNAPLSSADSQITVKVEESHVLLSADMTLADPRGQTKEWQLLLPANAKVEVKTPAGLGFDLLYPDTNRPQHVIRLAEPSTERLAVNVQARFPRPLSPPRLPVGPFFVLGKVHQEGVITVIASPKTLQGQRLVLHRLGDVFPRDVPKGAAGADVAAIYKFWTGAGAGREAKESAAKIPLEIELQSDKSLAEAGIDHFLQLKPAAAGWLIEATTTIQLKSRPDFLDIQLPHLPMPAPSSGISKAWAVPVSFVCEDDNVTLTLANAQGKARATWNRFAGNEIKLVGKYRVAPGADRVLVDLPRPVNVLDCGAKVKIKVPEQLELLAGAEGPLLDKHEARLSQETFPASVEFAWKPYRLEFQVAGVSDIWLHEGSAEVTQQLNFTVPAGAAHADSSTSAATRWRVPAAIKDLTVMSGGKLVLHDAAKETAWIMPGAEPFSRAEIVLRYDFALPKREDSAPRNGPRLVEIPFVWPIGATREDAKVRIWSEPGTNPVLAEHADADEMWKNFGIELVPGTDVLPALVLRGTGLNLSLAVQLAEPTPRRLASMVCDRALIQVAIDGAGNQTYRARYWVQKLNTRQLEVEFPMPAGICVVNVWLDQKKINNWLPLEADPNGARIPIQAKLYAQPSVLEIEYKLPATFTTGKLFRRTTLYAPQFQGEAFVGSVRWQVGLPSSLVGLTPAGNLDYHWEVQGWLLEPQASLSNADLELWREGNDPSIPVSLAFVGAGPESVQLLHLSRQLWLLLCSAALLALGLTVFVVPLPRLVFWLVVIGLGGGVVVIALFWPGWLAALAFGCEPGVLVLIVLLALQWMLQERYRRQLVFMPGFKRLKNDSSLIRSGSSGNRREPSTIDAPTPSAGSSSPINTGLTKGS